MCLGHKLANFGKFQSELESKITWHGCKRSWNWALGWERAHEPILTCCSPAQEIISHHCVADPTRQRCWWHRAYPSFPRSVLKVSQNWLWASLSPCPTERLPWHAHVLSCRSQHLPSFFWGFPRCAGVPSQRLSGRRTFVAEWLLKSSWRRTKRGMKRRLGPNMSARRPRTDRFL